MLLKDCKNAPTSVILKIKFGMVGSALLPTCTKDSTVRFWNRTSIFGNFKSTLWIETNENLIVTKTWSYLWE